MIKKAIIQRRTYHHFLNTSVDEAIIEEALSLVIHAPNHHLTYPYRFYRIGDTTKGKLLANALTLFKQRDEASAQKRINRWQDIPGWIIVTQINSEHDQQYLEDYATLSISLYILMLALQAHHVGSKWSTGSLVFSDEWYDICDIHRTDETIQGLFWYGYPEKMPKAYPKPDHHQFIINRD